MNHLFRSHVIQLFRSRYRAVWIAPVVAAALAILLTSPAAYARTTMTTSSASTPMATLTLATLANANGFSCPPDNICVFNGTNYTGTVQFGPVPGVNTYYDLHIRGGSNWRTLSFKNNGDDRVWLNQFTTGNHGISHCMSPNSRSRNITGPWDTDRWLLASANSAPC